MLICDKKCFRNFIFYYGFVIFMFECCYGSVINIVFFFCLVIFVFFDMGCKRGMGDEFYYFLCLVFNFLLFGFVFYSLFM